MSMKSREKKKVLKGKYDEEMNTPKTKDEMGTVFLPTMKTIF